MRKWPRVNPWELNYVFVIQSNLSAGYFLWYKRILNFQSSYLGVIDSFTCRTVEEGHIMIFRGARWLRLKKRNTKIKDQFIKLTKAWNRFSSRCWKKLFQIHLQKKGDFLNEIILRKKEALEKFQKIFLNFSLIGNELGYDFWPNPSTRRS